MKEMRIAIETCNLFYIDEIPLKIVLHFRQTMIESIHLNIMDNVNVSTVKDPETQNRNDINQTIKNEIEYIWNLLAKYFRNPQINHLTFFNHLIDNHSIYSTVTPFYQKIYQELCKTKSGDTLTYKDLAHRINSNAFRVVGSAMKSNRFPILIPCHRVIAQDSIGGYMGLTSKLKMDDALFNLGNSEFYNDSSIPVPIKIKILLIKFEKVHA